MQRQSRVCPRFASLCVHARLHIDAHHTPLDRPSVASEPSLPRVQAFALPLPTQQPPSNLSMASLPTSHCHPVQSSAEPHTNAERHRPPTWKPPSGLSMPRSPPRPTTWQVGRGRPTASCARAAAAWRIGKPEPGMPAAPEMQRSRDHGRLPLTPVLWAHWPARMVAREGQHTAKLVMSAVVVERVQSS